MSFAAFELSIQSPDLKAVAAHWNSARGTHLMPSWSDIRPSAIAKQLPIIWSYIYEPDQDDFVGRIGGEAINRIFGRNIKGAKLSELNIILDRNRLAEILKRVMQEPALVGSFSTMFFREEQYGVGERIILPLGADRYTGDSILGATDYRTRGPVLSDLAKMPAREEWFSLVPESDAGTI